MMKEKPNPPPSRSTGSAPSALRVLAPTMDRKPQQPEDTFAFAERQDRLGAQKPTPSSSSPDRAIFPFPAAAGLEPRFRSIRFGKASRSRSSPVSSEPESSKSEILSISPITRQAIASVPMLTPSSPFSSRMIVLSETPARSANSLTEMRRFKRAILMFVPNTSRARRALREGILTAISDCQYIFRCHIWQLVDSGDEAQWPLGSRTANPLHLGERA